MRAAKIAIFLGISTGFAQKIIFVSDMTIEPIAHIVSPFSEKFGIPRQSRLAGGSPASVVFEPGYGLQDAVRGLADFSHIWLIWGFSEARWDGNLPVSPPRLWGNTRIGVFASRSPFRPNSLGMSAVRLESIEMTADRGPVLHVLGADLLDGTPIYDIKPYIHYTDCIPEALDGYTGGTKSHRLRVEFAPEALSVCESDVSADSDRSEESPVCESGVIAHGEGAKGTPVCESDVSAPGDGSKETSVCVTDVIAHGGIDADILKQIRQLLELDPRVSYDSDSDKVWGMCYGPYNISFTVSGNTATVIEISRR